MKKKRSRRSLKPCPASPNCVSSQAKDKKHFIEPIPFSTSPNKARKLLAQTVASLPRTKIITEESQYLHAECRSLIFRFVDDLEFVVDEKTKTIHVRSASRIGYSDLGANRKRVESVRKKFQARISDKD